MLAGFFICICLRRSTLMSRGPPVACAEPWRVAQPDGPHLKNSRLEKLITSMSQEHTDSDRDDLFGEVISSYTDADAIDDGGSRRSTGRSRFFGPSRSFVFRHAVPPGPQSRNAVHAPAHGCH